MITQGAPILVPPGQGGGDSQTLIIETRRRLSISPGCDGLHLQLAPRAHGTRLKAIGHCANLHGMVRIRAIVSSDCSKLMGSIKEPRVPKRSFVADLATGCGDGLFDADAGEECDGATGCSGALVCSGCRCQSPVTTTTTVTSTTSTTLATIADADIVLLVPASSQDQEQEMIQLLQPWTDRARPLTVSVVSLQDIAPTSGAPALTAEAIRQYLRSHFTHRSTTTEHPRYLGLVAFPYPGYGDPAATLEVQTIPRFSVQIRDVQAVDAQLETDVPYGFLDPETIDGGDGFVDPVDLDMRSETFTVFRIPIAQPANLTRFVDRSARFAEAEYRSDVTLVAGEYAIPGDTSVVQCVNADKLAQGGGAGLVYKVFDYPTCQPDFLTTNGLRLADFLSQGIFAGGMIYNISHGNFSATYHAEGTNLALSDLDRLPPDQLNVFVSIACANDEHVSSTNFAMGMYLHNSVAVVSATANLSPRSGPSVIDAEINAFQTLYQAPVTLLQSLHQFRASYYERYAIDGPPEDRPYQWINLLAVDVLGDGLAVVEREH